jgi:predicted TIM-barrel fold metal-dependent hydrolase
MTDPFPLPKACDSHVHVIGPKRQYPLASERVYTPMEAPLEALEAMLARLGIERVVIVQPSFYGTDNTCTLDAVDRLGPRARAVAVLAPETPTAELDNLHRRGARGVRVNVATGGSDSLDIVRLRLEAAGRLCARNGWHVQTFISSALIEPLAPILSDLAVPVVIDHFGLIAPGEEQGRAAGALRRLLQSGRAWVKLSAAYRITPAAWTAMQPLAQLLAAENPDRVVWGSDWPHTPGHGRAADGAEQEEPFQDIDTGALLELTRSWFDDEARRKLLVDNPAVLYGF